ncbi:probable phospholipid-transporting ATPase 8 [Selaginella moellendorffii]|uniref:probable phospholipid-transporting ATPase 8 n=1 Tax=Selaginella moellendorffii TaxID=88036 RepID=UPI000D1C96F5|nr:probable phospholipid-transporting ATPase 8 [Selaginella moellendorffii]|eukprot:XP_024532104.1 probable phospholipid-transporting ATPase 8 [Selaginella moellendorffii]
MGPDFLVHVWKSARKCWSGRSKRGGDAEDLLAIADGDEHEVHCNNPPLNAPFRYPDNRTWTTKYTWYSFVPRSLFEQYRRAAYWYFTAMAGLSLTPFSPYRPVSVILPLLFVIALGMARELWEDVRRARGDREINSRPVTCCTRGTAQVKLWRELLVGDVVKVKDKEFFPADLLLLQSSNSDGVCYVETKNLDGETNLKVRQASQSTCHLVSDESFKDFDAVLKCEPPNASLYTFSGRLEFPNGQVSPMGPPQVLLRDSCLQNTDYVYGVVIYAGRDTKVMRNAINPPSKRSRMDQKLDHIMWVMFGILFVMSLATGLAGGLLTRFRLSRLFYFRPFEDNPYYNPRRAAIAGIIAFVNGLVLYGYLIPISLYVTLEIVRVIQALFIGQDLGMYDEETDRPAKVKSSGLNEELGQVDTILSDKTGTLTANQMDFCKCTIDGTSYGTGSTDVERASKRLGIPFLEAHAEDADTSDPVVKGFNFQDDRLMDGKWLKQENADRIKLFFQTLALCHTALPEGDIADPKSIQYRAESPDETALVVAAQQFGYVFYKKTPTTLYVREITGTKGETADNAYELLNVLEFSSARKRMSVIVRLPGGNIVLLSKGADSVMLDRLDRHDEEHISITLDHLRTAGIKIWVLTGDKMETAINIGYACSLLRPGMDKLIVSLGGSSVQVLDEKLSHGGLSPDERARRRKDELQNLVRQQLDDGLRAFESNIELDELPRGNSSSRHEGGSGRFANILQRDSGGVSSFRSFGSQNLQRTMSRDRSSYTKMDDAVNDAYALVIDGDSLAVILTGDLQNLFMELATKCSSVICCRVSPKQKAFVAKLVMKGLGKDRLCLAIGDGANDVGMIQVANVGVGIIGVEGAQAAMAADFTIAKFRFLERLLLVHGHWCYRRISVMIRYFLFKVCLIGWISVYSNIFTVFSGNPLYDDWYASFYSTVFTALPVGAVGTTDQDVSADDCIRYPQLYRAGQRQQYFNTKLVFLSIIHSVYASLVIFFFPVALYLVSAFRSNGQPAALQDFGAALFTGLVLVPNLQLFTYVHYFTWIHHFLIWGSILVWFLFLIVYGSLSPELSTGAFREFVEVLAPSPSYWLLQLLVVVVAIFPDVIVRSFQWLLRPADYQIVLGLAKFKSQTTTTTPAPTPA